MPPPPDLIRRCRTTAVALVAVTVVLTATAAGPATGEAGVTGEGPSLQSMRRAGPTEVWQAPQRAHPENPSNPLADRVWGVYVGPQDQVWRPYDQATGKQKRLLRKIALRPRTKWYGAFVPDDRIQQTVRDYIAASQDGDAEALVQLAVFRMRPWEHAACERAPRKAERTSYRRWIRNLAAGIGDAHTLVVMQPDGPFLWCVTKPKVTAALLTFATKSLSELPNTSVYIDAGAADWCENERAPDPERCASILKRTGIEYARGFALDSTHYTGPGDNVRHGAAIVDILRRDGFGAKHFIIDTAKSGRPMWWRDVIPSAPGELKNDARVCRTKTMRRCVTLGIPPTVRVAAGRWGLSDRVRQLAAEHVDGFVWFGRPWLYRQADPFVMKRALTMARTTPWPGPPR
jgi:hypothetical protein